MTSIMSNERANIPSDSDNFFKIIELLENLPDSTFLNVFVEAEDGKYKEVYSKRQVIDSFLVGYSNRYDKTLDLVDKFNLYQIYSELPKSEILTHLIYSILYIGEAEIRNSEEKVEITLKSIRESKVSIWN